MKYNKLSNTDLKVSEICLGTMTFGRQNTEKEAHEQLDFAVGNGVNFIDTAELYAVPTNKNVHGLTEEYIGSWISSRKKRDDIILATKIIGHSSGLDFIRVNPSFSDVHLNEAVEKSLKRLQTDYIDLYQLHWPMRNTNMFGKRAFPYDTNDKWQEDFAQVVESMDKLIKAGKIRHWGVSNETPWGLMKYIKIADENNWPRPVSIQNPYNLLNRTYEYGNAEVSMYENIGLLAYSPMSFGLLSGKYHIKNDKSDDRLNQFKELSRYNSQLSYRAAEGYIGIAKKYGFSPAQMALEYVSSRPFVTSTIIGATKIEQLKENIESQSLNLPLECIKDINNLQEIITNPAP